MGRPPPRSSPRLRPFAAAVSAGEGPGAEEGRWGAARLAYYSQAVAAGAGVGGGRHVVRGRRRGGTRGSGRAERGREAAGQRLAPGWRVEIKVSAFFCLFGVGFFFVNQSFSATAGKGCEVEGGGQRPAGCCLWAASEEWGPGSCSARETAPFV